MSTATDLLKRELAESYQRLADVAEAHHSESIRFHKLCEKYYGIEWYRLPSLIDHDPIIDTIDYGTDTLPYDQFDKLVVEAIKERDAAQEVSG